MTCTTCGRENPPHLTFCQECGQRLGPRVAPPTPPIGLGVPPSAGPAASSPARPTGAAQLAQSAPQPSRTPSPAQADGEMRRCAVCETPNAPNLRYCTACGSALAQAQPVASAPGQAQPVASAPAAAPPAPAAPIAPLPVLDLMPAAPAPGSRTCPRCRGTTDAGAAFCKFCGFALSVPEVAMTNANPKPAGTAPLAAPLGAGASSPAAPRVSAAPAPVEDRAPPPIVPIAPIAPRMSGAPSAPQTAPASVPASAPAKTYGRLVVIAKSGADGPSYPIVDGLDIGRTDGTIVVAEDPYLSPRHARLAIQDGALVLRDLASTNGVYLRLTPTRDAARGGKLPKRWTNVFHEKAATPKGDGPGEVLVPLEDHDAILVGQQVFAFDILSEPEAGLGTLHEHGTLVFGSPAARRYARLSQKTVEGITRDVYYVRKMETVLGRESGDIVFAEDPFLSRRHVALRLVTADGGAVAKGASPKPSEIGEAYRFALVDLGSSNGTFLKIREPVKVASGDQFRIGQQLFRVELDAPPSGKREHP